MRQLAADPPGEVGWGGLGAGQVGDAVGDDGSPFAFWKGRTQRVTAMASAACGKASPAAAVVLFRASASQGAESAT
jgi:hypothetical protein